MPIFFGAMKGGSTSGQVFLPPATAPTDPAAHGPARQEALLEACRGFQASSFRTVEAAPTAVQILRIRLDDSQSHPRTDSSGFLLFAASGCRFTRPTAKSLRGMLLWIEVNSRQSRNSAIHQIFCLPINVRCFPEFDLYLQESELRESRNWGIQFTILYSLVTSMPKVA